MRDPVTVGDQPAPRPGRLVSLRSAQALSSLYRLVWDHDTVHALASHYSTWDQLAAAGFHELAPLLGARAATFALPPAPPAGPDLPEGTELVSRYSLGYPQQLREVGAPPVVLAVRGTLPAGPAVAIGGAEHPSPQGVEITRSAALAAVAQRLPVVALLSDGIGVTALRSVVAAGGHAVVVVPHGLDQVSKHAALLEEVVAAGGALVSEVPAGVGVSEHFTILGARIVAALAQAVVLAEVGRHVSSGAPLARAAIGAGRFLVVPTPQQHYVPESALGLRVLTETRSFSEAWYGSSPRVDARVENGLSPADAVVTSQAGIAQAIAVACAPTRPGRV